MGQLVSLLFAILRLKLLLPIVVGVLPGLFGARVRYLEGDASCGGKSFADSFGLKLLEHLCFFLGAGALYFHQLTLAPGGRALVLLLCFLLVLLKAVEALRHALATEGVVLVDLLELIAQAFLRFLWRELDFKLLYSFSNLGLVACVIT